MSLGLKAHAKGVVKAERKFNSNRVCAKLRGRVIAHKGVPMTKARVLRSPVIGKPSRGVLKWGRGPRGPRLP